MTYRNLFGRTVFAAALFLGAMGNVACIAAPQNDEAARKGAAVPSISVAILKDMGGVATKGPDGKPIAERLSLALKKFLQESAKGRYTVGNPGTTKFSVEGEISSLEIGPNAKRPYVVVARLYREDKQRKLVAEFCGKAPTLRGLTGNLESQPDTGPMGLLGGIAKEIGKATVGASHPDYTAAFDNMVKSATATRRITVDVIGTGGDQKPRQQLISGEKYHLRVSSQDAGAVYITTYDKGRPIVPYAQTEPLDVAVGSPVILPPNVTFAAPKVKEPTTIEYLIFVRKGGGVPGGVPGTQTGTETGTEATANPSSSLNPRSNLRQPIQVAGADSKAIGNIIAADWQENDDKIELLTVVGSEPEGDLGLAALVQQFESDPAGKWIGVRVKIAVNPVGTPGSPAPGNAASGTKTGVKGP